MIEFQSGDVVIHKNEFNVVCRSFVYEKGNSAPEAILMSFHNDVFNPKIMKGRKQIVADVAFRWRSFEHINKGLISMKRYDSFMKAVDTEFDIKELWFCYRDDFTDVKVLEFAPPWLAKERTLCYWGPNGRFYSKASCNIVHCEKVKVKGNFEENLHLLGGEELLKNL